MVTKEMGRARSSPAFSYYTVITPPMTILPSSPTVKGFTANNLRGSVRSLRLGGNGSLNGLLGGRRLPGGCPAACATVRPWFRGDGSARRIVGGCSAHARWLPDGLRVSIRRMVRFETGLAACPTARSYQSGVVDRSTHARRLPDGLRISLRRMVRDTPGGLPDGSLVSVRCGGSLQRMV